MLSARVRTFTIGALLFFGVSVCGQTPGEGASTQKPQEPIAAVTTAPDRNIPSVLHYPFLIEFKNGHVLRGNIVEADREILTIEAAGKTFQFHLRDVKSISEKPVLLTTFGDVPSNELKHQLDWFVTRLQQEPKSNGYVVVYGERTGPAFQAKKRADLAKEYLIYTRKVNTERITSLDQCFAPKLKYELWIVPAGQTLEDPCPKKPKN